MQLTKCSTASSRGAPSRGVATPLRAVRLKTLIIDNYDSYTFNLYQLIANVNGSPPLVVQNDAIDIDDVRSLLAKGAVQNIVISPGPGRPEDTRDVGIVTDVLRTFADVPILGVCLGHQALASVHGANIVAAPEPVHGRLSTIQHDGHALFDHIPAQGFNVVRYHSLLVDASSLPPTLQPTCWTSGPPVALSLHGEQQSKNSAADAEHLIMGLAHIERPHVGVQFHPESIATSYGPRMLHNFANMTRQHCQISAPLPPLPSDCLTGPACADEQHTMHAHDLPWIEDDRPSAEAPLQLAWTEIHHPAGVSCDALLKHLCKPHTTESEQPCCAPNETFWLDSSDRDRGRFSYLGAKGGPLWRRFTYQLPEDGMISGNHDASAAGDNTTSIAKQTSSRGLDRRPDGDPMSRAPSSVQSLNGNQRAGIRNTASPTYSSAHVPGNGTCVPGDVRGGSAATIQQLDELLPRRNISEAGTQRNGSTASAALHCSDGRASGAIETRINGEASSSAGSRVCGQLQERDVDGNTSTHRCRFFEWLDSFMRSRRIARSSKLQSRLPFDFWGGLVGYIGYEMKGECGATNAHTSRHSDCAFFFADRLLALDHHTNRIYILALHTDDPTAKHAADTWIADQACSIRSLCTSLRTTSPASSHPHEATLVEAEAARPFTLAHDRPKYLEDIARCKSALYSGNSYEICLTNELNRVGAPHPWELYGTLRTINKAPYSAWLHFGEGNPVVCCSSPERFLRLGRGSVLEARPIKGTAARVPDDPAADAAAAAELAASEKNRAENLMIVDLLRNDLGRVCKPGTIHVPDMMSVQTFASVHQLVSTITGTKADDISASDCIRAAFPGGSMTGAPKVRSMEIIDAIEGRARGPYSGSIGYLSVNGTFDLNIVIRTAVIEDDIISIGAGGAIVVQSDPDGEFDEMKLKARRLLRAVDLCDKVGTLVMPMDS